MPRAVLGLLLLAALTGCSASRSGSSGPAGGPGPGGDAVADAALANDAGPALADAGGDAGGSGDAGLPHPADGGGPADGGAADGAAPADGGAPADEGAPADAATRCCAPGPLLEQTFDLLPAAPSCQIHAAATLDGDGVWVSYVVPELDGSGGFDVWALRLGCDGTVAIPAFLVQAGDTGNDIDPDLAVSQGNLCIAWMVDTGGEPNLFVRTRSYRSRDGLPLLPADELDVPWRNGAAVTGSAWMPRLAAQPGGGFLLAGAWGLEEAQRFQVFLQRLDPSCRPVGAAPDAPESAIDAFFEPGVSQSDPALVMLADGSAQLAWSRSPDDGSVQVVHTRLAPDARATSPSPPVVAIPAIEGSAPSLAVAGDGSGAVYLAFQREGPEMDIFLQEAAQLAEQAPFLVLGQPRRQDHSPQVAAGEPGRGAVAWYRTRLGIHNDLIVQGFRYDGQHFARDGEERLLNPPEEGDDHAAAPYPLALLHVGAGAYLVLWSEGVSPDFRIKARFFRP